MGFSNGNYMTLHLNETETKKRAIFITSVRNILPVVRLFPFNPHQRINCTPYITLRRVCSSNIPAHQRDEEQHRGSKHTPGHVGPLPLTLSSSRWIRARGDGCVCGVPSLQQHVSTYKYVCVGSVPPVGPFSAFEFHSSNSRSFSFFPSVSLFKKWRGEQRRQHIRHVTGEQSTPLTQSAGHETIRRGQHREPSHTENNNNNNTADHGGSQHTHVHETSLSATPFKVLPKQSASDTVISH
ncbi:hypothetical protein MOQ_001814, partial [Trypanosoma cruzi marinkellei]